MIFGISFSVQAISGGGVINTVTSSTNGNTVTFTIKLKETIKEPTVVNYRTMDGSAVGGIHFEHISGHLIIPAGSLSATVNVTLKDVNKEKLDYYQNNKRNFTFVAWNDNKKISTNCEIGNLHKIVYPKWNTNYRYYPLDKQLTTDGSNWNGGKKQKKINDDDGTVQLVETPITDIFKNQEPKYWIATGQKLNYCVYTYFDLFQNSDGYFHIGVSYKGYKSPLKSSLNDNFLLCTCDIVDGYSSNYVSFKIPDKINEGKGAWYDNLEYGGSLVTLGNNVDAVKFPINDNVEKFYITVAADGSGDDEFVIKNLQLLVNVEDVVAPSVQNVYCSTSKGYDKGDDITVSVKFDEIVNVSTSAKLTTSVGDFTYASGNGTNTLCFKGSLSGSSDVKGLSVDEINQNVKDLRDNSFKSGNKNIGKSIPEFYYRSTMPNNLSSTVDLLGKSVTLTWTSSTSNPSGSWYVYRWEKNDFAKSFKEIGKTQNTSYTDYSLNYDTEYEYLVEFVPKDHKPEAYQILKEGSIIDVTLNREDFKINAFNVTPGPNQIELSWRTTQKFPENGTEYYFDIYRGNNTIAEKVTEYNYVDKNVPDACTSYSYQIKTSPIMKDDINKGGKQYISETKEGKMTGKTSVTEFSVSQGNENEVNLSWKVNQIGTKETNFILYRKEMDSTTDDYKKIDEIDGNKTTYLYSDKNVSKGIKYSYKLKYTSCDRTDSVLVDEGYCKAVGSISGMVTYSNGGTVKGVTITAKNEKGEVWGTTTTNENGYYRIDNIPFINTGATYTVTPTMGTHNFKYKDKEINTFTCVFTSTSSDFTDVDFIDKSDFPVSGKVLFYQTNYPVVGANLYVDGNLCYDSNKEPIETDENGEFKISVPNGDHDIQVKMQNHVFVNRGLLKLENLNQEKSNLEFLDSTFVTLTGRVAGGVVEKGKVHGLGQGKANIGKATIVLTAGELYQMNTNDTNNRSFANPSATNVHSTASTGRFDHEGEAKKITIHTDSVTGEFSVSLPPIDFAVEEVKIDNNPDVSFDLGTIPTINLGTGNLQTKTDSIIRGKDDTVTFDYVYALDMIYRSDPKMVVTPLSNKDGAFGDDKYIYKDEITGITDTIPLYTIEDGKIQYSFGYPLFTQNEYYDHEIYAYELYENKDVNPVVSDEVPLVGASVSISNDLGATQVYIEDGVDEENVSHNAGEILQSGSDELTLDSLGKMKFKFMATFPNIVEPYTLGMNITYSHENNIYTWDQNTFEGIVIGGLQSGNNFVTGGPVNVSYVLRDPSGTGSYAYLEKGSSFSSTKALSNAVTSENSQKLVASIGQETSTVSGMGVAVINTIKVTSDVEEAVECAFSFTDAHTYTTTITTTETISTSDASNYVGEAGDVFIGTGTNYIFGKERMVDVSKYTDGDSYNYKIDMSEAIGIGQEFTTAFKYTQNYIENVLIPNYQMARNSIFRQVSSADYNKSYPNHSDQPIYITTLSPDDERLGSRNTDKEIWGAKASKVENEGPSYIMILPDAEKSYADTIVWFNSQIETWNYELYKNEETKVKAIESGSPIVNHSFDSGTSVENSVETCNDSVRSLSNIVEAYVVLGLNMGTEVNSAGVKLESSYKDGYNLETTDESVRTSCTTVGYALVEDGDDDALTIDVYEPSDGFGPVFYTRAGQTTCPYEDERVTRYFEPGKHVLAEKTMQIEIPRIRVENPIVTDVPSGMSADFKLLLDNLSETDEDVWYYMYMVDQSNSDGAALSIDGVPFSGMKETLIKAGETLEKSLSLKQSRFDITDYDSIAIVLASQCQYDGTDIWDVIADTVYLSAHFVPTCSPVILTLDKGVMNSSTGDTLQLVLTDYEKDFLAFNEIRVQYKRERDNNWTLSQSVSVDSIEGARYSFTFPMSSVLFNDQVYQFRALSVCPMGTNTEITVASDVVSVIKDMSRPMTLGNPNPSDGILEVGDEVSVTFNEDIQKDLLSKNDNFIVQAVLNDAKVDHNVALKFSNTSAFTATTEAKVALNEKDFSLDMWVNVSSEGVILQHGLNESEAFVLSVEPTGQLSVTIDGKKVTSTNKIPFDKWSFLTISYSADASNPTINSLVAYDAETVKLFENTQVPLYKTSGLIALGKNINGAISELTLWDKSRSNVDAQGQMYNMKSAATEDLIGYWKFDEGHGLVANDVARNRNMILPSESWYLNNINYAAHFDGENHLSMNISRSCPQKSDDYMLELWFRGNSQKNATIWSANTTLALAFNASGYLTLIANGTENQLSTNNYLDGVWHHAAVNVLRNGMTTVYVDGVAVKQLSSDNIPALDASELTIGAQRYYEPNIVDYSYNDNFVGDVDEVRYWIASFNAKTIDEFRYIRLNGNEAGLEAYYPFEDTQKNMGLTEYVFTKKDMCSNSVGDAAGSVEQSESAPSLKLKPEMSNVDFSFVSSERTVIISLNEKANRLEGTTVYVTVKNIRDLNDNYSLPVTWTAFINQNRLVWSDDEITIEKDDEMTSSFEVSVVNQGAVTESWSISGLPSWLSASKTSGSLAAKKNEKISFEISDATPVGTYEESIYLTGNDEVSMPLTLIVKVTANKPDWSVDPSQYKNSMSVLAQLKVDGKYSSDEDDMVAAFINDVCVGVASPVYYPRYDAYFISLGVYGNDTEVDKNITFKAWDASTGITYPSLSTSSPISFENNKLYGSMTNPILFESKVLQEQILSLKKGWNWISLNVSPENDDINNVFGKVASETNLMKSKVQVAYSDGDSLFGNLNTTNLGLLYKVHMNDNATLNIVGNPVDPTKDSVSVKTGWNWIGFNSVSNMSLGAAFADLSPVDGDMVKSQTAFAIYTDYEWVGTLSSLTSGKGYMYKSVADKNRSFTYPAKMANLRMAPMKAAPKNALLYTPVDETVYSSNMTIAAVVKADGEIVPNAQVGVFDANGECRAAGTTGYKSMIFLVVLGESSKDALTFKVMVNGFEYTIDQALNFEEDANLGTLQEPYVIDLGSGEITKLDFENANLTSISVYPTFVETELNVESQGDEVENYAINDITGKLIMNAEVNSSDFSINVSNLSQGVYLIKLKTSLGTVVKQFTKK